MCQVDLSNLAKKGIFSEVFLLWLDVLQGRGVSGKGMWLFGFTGMGMWPLAVSGKGMWLFDFTGMGMLSLIHI